MEKITTPFSTCFVCCKKVKFGPEVDKKRGLICEQFLVLMSRYLNLIRGDDHDDYGSEKTLDILPGFRKRRRKRGKLFSCDHCLPLIESVCEIYKDWSFLQVKLNGSIKLIAKLMLDVSVSMANCAIEVTEDFQEAVDFRIRFIKQALKKPNSKDFPHLALNRLSTDSSSRVAVSEEETITNKTTDDVNSESDCKVVPKQEVEEKSEDEVDLDIADFDTGSPGTGIIVPKSDVQMNYSENDDDDDYYDEGDNNEMETPEVSQKRKKIKKKLTESTDDVNKPFNCKICGKGFAKQKYQQDHEKRHAQPFRCRLCVRRFSLRSNLRAHEKLHKEGKANPFQCGVCSRSFLQWAKCASHIRRVHKGKGNVLRCGSDNTKEINVQSTDDVDKSFKCQICGKGFLQQKSLLDHEKRHAHPFRCNFCVRRFSSTTNLLVHEKLHKEGKANQFQCGVCNRFFLQRTACNCHIRQVHEGKGDVLRGGVKWQPGSDIKQKIAEKIRRGFSRVVDKAKHEKTHRNKSFKCPHCGMTFKRVSVFNSHVNRHLKPFECGLCGKRFGDRSYCRIHQNVVHKVIEGVILKISAGVTNDTSPMTPLNNEANRNLHDVDDGIHTVSADKASESETLETTINAEKALEPTPENENQVNADDTIGEVSDSGSADIWQPGSDAEDDNDDADDKDHDIANNEGHSQEKDESNPVQVKGNAGNSKRKRKPKRLSNKEIAELRARDPLPFKCEECGKGFPLPGHLKLHARVAHNGVQWQCDTCGTQFKYVSTFKRHLAEERCTKSASCRRTRKPNVKKPAPEQPQVTQVEDPLPFKCIDCDQTFAVHVELRHHRKTVHNKGVLYRCKICERTCRDLYSFKQHQNIHTKAKPLTCRFCFAKSFNRDTSRRVHEITCDANPLKGQIDLNKHKCGICGRAFRRPSQLQKHAHEKHGAPKAPSLEPEESNSGKGDVICEKCGKVFPYPNHKALYRHTVAEHGEDYPCSVCGKVYNNIRYLHSHERLHQEPGYECGHCGDKFYWDTSCRNHIKQKHKGLPRIVHNLLKNPNPIGLPLPTPTGAPDSTSEDTDSPVPETPVVKN